MKTFLICPVRGYDQTRTKLHVDKLESEGWTVHWPSRDTDQNDDSGLRICRDNTAAIVNADVVHVIWDGASQGCLFDMGVAFSQGKRIIPIEMPARTPHKSFQNMVSDWSRESA